MNRKVSVQECRACLRKVEDEICHELFQVGDVSWASPGAVIATDLAKLAGIEISEHDKHSRFICPQCYNRLADAMSFIMTVRRSDDVLKKQFAVNDNETSRWPKPIPTTNSMNNETDNQMEVQIKQEVLSEDEYSSNYMDQDWEPTMDIKIEPEEFVAPVPSDMFYKSPLQHSLEGTCEERINGDSNSYEEEFLDSLVKQEPLSNDELEALEALPDLPLDCMLCLKKFQSVTGLKAHVIAQHSYGSVNRNPPTTVPMQKEQTNEFVCATCRKNFETRTDLMVHESCHNKYACYICDAKFNTFRQLTRHGARCRKRHTPLPRSRPTRPQILKQTKTNLSKEHKETVLGQVNDLIPIKEIKIEPSEPIISPPHREETIVDYVQIFSAPISDSGNSLKVLSIDEDDSSQSKEVALQNTNVDIPQIKFLNTADTLQNSRGNSGNTESINKRPITVQQSTNEQKICEQKAEWKQVLIKQEKKITSEQPIDSKQLKNKQLSNEQQVSKQPIKLEKIVDEEAKQKLFSNIKEEKREISKQQMKQKQPSEQEVGKQPMEPKQVSNKQKVGGQPTELKQLSNKQVGEQTMEPKQHLNEQEVDKQLMERQPFSNEQEISQQPMESKEVFNKQEVNKPSKELRQLSNNQEAKEHSNEQEINERIMDSNQREVNVQTMELKQIFNEHEVIDEPMESKQLSNEQKVIEKPMETRQLSNEQEASDQPMVSELLFNEHDVSEKPVEPKQHSNGQPKESDQHSNEQDVSEIVVDSKQLSNEQPKESKQLSNEQDVSEKPVESKQLSNEQPKESEQLSSEQDVSEKPVDSKQLSNEQPNESEHFSNEQDVNEKPVESGPLSNEQPKESEQLFSEQDVSEKPMDPKQLSNEQIVGEQPVDSSQLSSKQEVNEESMESKQPSNEQASSEKLIETKSDEQENIGQIGLKQLSDNQGVNEQLEPKQLPCTVEVIGENFDESVPKPNKRINISTLEVNEPSPETPISGNPFANDVDGISNTSEDNIPNTSEIKINLEITTR